MNRRRRSDGRAGFIFVKIHLSSRNNECVRLHTFYVVFRDFVNGEW